MLLDQLFLAPHLSPSLYGSVFMFHVGEPVLKMGKFSLKCVPRVTKIIINICVDGRVSVNADSGRIL